MADEHASVIPIESDADVVTARQRARQMAGELELTSTDQTLLATAISEVARNITTYAVRGEVHLSVVRDDDGREGHPGHRPRRGSRHRGRRPGAAGRLHERRRARPRAARRAPAGRRLLDRDGAGTGDEGHARDVGAAELARGMTGVWPLVLERGEAGLAHAGERRSGDLAVFAPSARGGLVAVIDGLGHGDAAADASEVAAEILSAHADDEPQRLLERCHEELRRTRGAVMTLAWFDLAERHDGLDRRRQRRGAVHPRGRRARRPLRLAGRARRRRRLQPAAGPDEHDRARAGRRGRDRHRRRVRRLLGLDRARRRGTGARRARARAPRQGHRRRAWPPSCATSGRGRSPGERQLRLGREAEGVGRVGVPGV